MDVSISALIAQIINFAIIFWLFSKFAAKPLANEIENRRALLAKLEHADQAYAQKLQEAEKQAEKIIAE
jgi:F0F1-type ATP synthase membrane subunit b/b'